MGGCVIEFTGGPGDWRQRQYWGYRNGGSFCNGRRLSVSSTSDLRDCVVATELVHYADLWPHLQKLHLSWTRDTRGVRMCGAAAANLCHLAEGQVDAYWQFNLKPWDAAAGVIIAEEAGARVSTCDGTAFSVFDKSLLATNDALMEKALDVMAPVMADIHEDPEVDLKPYVVQGYRVKSGPQLD